MERLLHKKSLQWLHTRSNTRTLLHNALLWRNSQTVGGGRAFINTCYKGERVNISTPRPLVLKVLNFPCYQSCYHTFVNWVVPHIAASAAKFEQEVFILNGYISFRSMGEPFKKGRLHGLIRLVDFKYESHIEIFLLRLPDPVVAYGVIRSQPKNQ